MDRTKQKKKVRPPRISGPQKMATQASNPKNER